MRIDTWESQRQNAREFKNGLKVLTEEYQSYSNETRYSLKIWRKRAMKPFANYYFESKKNRLRYLIQIVRRENNWLKRKKKAQEASKNYKHDYKIGDILVSSWGYEQTNVDFYQVVKINSSKTITIREISLKSVEGVSGMSDYVIPAKDSFCSDEMIKKVSIGGYVKFNGYNSAWKWDGNKKYRSWYA